MDCKCTLHQRMNGDGCDICNPAKALEICRENYATLAAAARRLVEAARWEEEIRVSINESNCNNDGYEELDASSENGWKEFDAALAEVEGILGEG